jgi:hypothetical protein
VPVEETVRSFKEIIEGKHDDIPERAFLMKGSIDEVTEAARGARQEEEQEAEGEEEESEATGQAASGGEESGREEQSSGEGDGEE